MHVLLEYLEIAIPIMRRIEEQLIGPLADVWPVTTEIDQFGNSQTIVTHTMKGKQATLSWDLDFSYFEPHLREPAKVTIGMYLSIHVPSGNKIEIYTICPISADPLNFMCTVESTLDESDSLVLRTLVTMIPQAYKEPQPLDRWHAQLMFMLCNFLMVENPLRDFEAEAVVHEQQESEQSESSE